MKGILVFALILCLSACSSKSSEDNVTLFEDGVSLKLAEYRARTISNVEYKLNFVIPKELNEEITGTEMVSFTYLGKEPFVIDFTADSLEQIKCVKLNDSLIDWQYINSHIVISDSLIGEGTNNLYIEFISGSRSLNRSQDYLYSLFVPDRARSVFPCFDQPNIKSCYNLSLTLPAEWIAASTTKVVMQNEDEDGRFKRVEFAKTEPLSTYHFSFVAGKFSCETKCINGKDMNIFYRETSPEKIEQLNDIFTLTQASVEWLEDYTDIKMPYSKYDIVILPGFQFGGMEHPGLIQYSDRVVFLEKNATPDDYFARASTIAHETTHLWFGDLVTMQWFNDVWTKEVFANYIAAKIVEPQFPTINHEMNFFRNYTLPAIAEDRTLGAYPIQQKLDNLANAGLVYGNIIYDKAPIMMRNLETLIGNEAFQRGIRRYLKDFSYGNATWDELIEILDSESPDKDLKMFSKVWVKERGIPVTTFIKKEDNLLVVSHNNFLNRIILLPQSIRIAVIYTDSTREEFNVEGEKSLIQIRTDKNIKAVIPNIDGRGYGRFKVFNTKYLLDEWVNGANDLERLAVLSSLYEEYLNHEITNRDFYNSLYKSLLTIENPQLLATVIGYLGSAVGEMNGDKYDVEIQIMNLAKTHKSPLVRQLMHSIAVYYCNSQEIVAELYKEWKGRSNVALSLNDYSAMSYELAIRMPEHYNEIYKIQRARLKDPDMIRKFDFVYPSCSGDTLVRDSVFNSLLDAKNRGIEPWVQLSLSNLNHRLREPYSNKYLYRALNELKEIQRTGDIFFPKGWCGSLLYGHRSQEAKLIVSNFLTQNPDYPVLLKNKLLIAAYPLCRN